MLQINTNLLSLNAQRHGARNHSALAQSVQRLSSGLRVNSAKDDAAGLAIAERFTAQIRGLQQATRNMNDAISWLHTAEGNLVSLTGLMQRGRELAVQAANGTNSAFDRQSLEEWFAEGAAEFVPGGDGRLAGVMNGTLDNQSAAQVTANIDNIRGAFGGSHLDYATAYAATRYLHTQIGGDGVKDMLAFLSADTLRTMDDYFATGAIGGVADADDFVADFKANGAAFISGLDLANNDTGGIGGGDADGGGRDTTLAGTIPDTNNPTTDPLQFFNEIWPELTPEVALQANRSLIFQAGAEAGQTISVSSRNLSITTLGLVGVNVATSAGAAIGIFSAAIEAISSLRAEFGAAMNRFDSAISNAQTAVEAASASRSRVVDADFAAETAALTRSQILQQASNAMIAQANSLPQMVLRLLQSA